jgi:hypothetical protein
LPGGLRKQFLWELGEGFAQAAYDALLTEYDHRIEERRRYRLPDDGHAAGVDQQAGFYAGGLGDRARSVIARIVIPF